MSSTPGSAKWLLLRGLTREARHWGDFPAQLSESLGQPVQVLDLPGNGLLRGQRSPASVSEMVDALRRQLKAQGLAMPFPPLQVLGMSLGGMVATHWAQRYPAEVSRLVLVNTSMRPHARFDQRLPPRNWPALLAMAAHWQDGDAVERNVHRLTCQRDARLEDDIRQWRFIRESAPVIAGNAWRQLWAAARFSSGALPPRCPVLVLSSAGDALVDPACSLRLARTWRAAHIEHPWAGHDLPHDDADWVCREVTDWLREPAGEPASDSAGESEET